MKTMINIPVDKLDTERYVRQLRSVVRWKQVTKARGTLEAATGFGKSTLPLILKAKMETLKKNLKYDGRMIVVVPTTPLKKQWEKTMSSLGLNKNTEVHVINTVSLGENFRRDCDLLVIDEIHLMAADKFSRIFDRIRYSWILGLTATMDRLDGKEAILKKYAPVCDTITQVEAIQKGWISDFIEFNLAVPITRSEIEKQKALNKEIRYFMSKFGDFNVMLSCLQNVNAKVYAQANGYETNEVVKWATRAIKAIGERKNLLETTERKIDIAVELIEEFNLKTITFSQATEFADAVANRLGKRAALYHSSMESRDILIDQSKEYKTVKGLQSRKIKLEKTEGVSHVEIDLDAMTIRWKKLKKVGSNTLADMHMSQFERNEISVLCSAKKLDQGFDDPTVQLGVDGSRSTNPTQHTQRTGRVARIMKLPNGRNAPKIYVNLYIPDWNVPNSRDEKKLRACQVKNPEKVIWVNNVSDLKVMLNDILTKRGQRRLN